MIPAVVLEIFKFQRKGFRIQRAGCSYGKYILEKNINEMSKYFAFSFLIHMLGSLIVNLPKNSDQMTLTMACKNSKMVSSSSLLMMVMLSNISLSVLDFFDKFFFVKVFDASKIA